LEPAGSDGKLRYALLRGKVRLAKGSDGDSAFEGDLELVLTYRLDAAEVHSVRGVVEGTYLYRTRETNREKLHVAIESRPEEPQRAQRGGLAPTRGRPSPGFQGV